MTAQHGEPTGSVVEEAVKLLSAIQDWVTENGHQYADAATEAAASASAAWRPCNEHIATGEESCTYCPVCRLISAFRATSPEVKSHLADSVTALSRALKAFTDGGSTPSPNNGPDVENIDVSDA